MAEKHREVINLDEHIVRCLLDENYEGHEEDIDFEFKQEKTTDTDLERGIVDKVAYIKRKSDGKFFEVEWRESPHRDLFEDISFPIRCYEVYEYVTITKEYRW